MAWQPPAGLAQCRCFLARCVSSPKHSCHFVQPTVVFWQSQPSQTARAGHRLGCHCHGGSSSGSSVMHLCSPCEAPLKILPFSTASGWRLSSAKKETAWLCHRTGERSFSPPPVSPNVRHSCICNQEMKGENTSLHCNSLSKLALRVHNHHSAAQCKMLFFQASCCDCPLQGLSRTLSGYFLASAFQLLLRFFTGQDGTPFSPESGHYSLCRM